MRSLLVLCLVATACDPLQVIEPLDDAPAPYVCTNTVFGRVEAEWNIDCQVFQQYSYMAGVFASVDAFSPHIKYEDWRSAMSGVTVHVKAVPHWTSWTGENVWGQTWFGRIDLGFEAKGLLHESYHIYDLAHTHLDTFLHPDWDKTCKNDGQDVWSCNYDASTHQFEYRVDLNWYGDPPTIYQGAGGSADAPRLEQR